MLQTHSDGEQKVLRLLGRDTYDICVVAIRHAGHKHFRLDDFASRRVNISELVAGKVHHEFLAGIIRFCEYRGTAFLSHEILLEMEIELGFAIATGMPRPVFLIKQLTCHMEFRIA